MHEIYDLLVAGGGITGCGVALDAAGRGLKVALVERNDWGSGTSSMSSKLIHGGLRYLSRMELGLVREGLRERANLLRLAPGLVRPLKFFIPSRSLKFRAGLTAYDRLAGDWPRHRAEEVLGIRGLSYWDASTDDARLVWTIAAAARDAGADLFNHTELVEFLRDRRGRVVGAGVRAGGEESEIRAKVVVNATGVWADSLRDSNTPDEITASKGIHLTVKSLDLDCALLIPHERRFIFVIPWVDGTTIIGTTDSPFALGSRLKAEESEVDYLLGIVAPIVCVLRQDVIATWAGLRPLVSGKKATTDLSRRHKISVSPSGVVTILGGKLTTYRVIAKDAVDAALGPGAPRSISHEMALLRPSAGSLLGSRYGHRAADVEKLIEENPELGERLHPQLPYLKAEAYYAIHFEDAKRLDDVLARRLRARITSWDGGLAALDWVSDELAANYAWDENRRSQEARAYRDVVEQDIATTKWDDLGNESG